jgi:hypothetical protein
MRTGWLLAGILCLIGNTLLPAQTPPASSPQELDISPSTIFETVPADRGAPRLSIQQDLGDGVGWRNGFTRLEGLIPLWEAPRQSLVFIDLRGVTFDDVNLWQFDGGAGYRWYIAIR